MDNCISCSHSSQTICLISFYARQDYSRKILFTLKFSITNCRHSRVGYVNMQATKCSIVCKIHRRPGIMFLRKLFGAGKLELANLYPGLSFQPFNKQPIPDSIHHLNYIARHPFREWSAFHCIQTYWFIEKAGTSKNLSKTRSN